MNSSDQIAPTRSKRLTKDGRRRQLLDVAKQILEDEGADVLTLAVLAERAGVSKPVAYDHFVSRSGLLVAMLEDTSQYYETDAEAKIAIAPQTIPAIAEIVAEAYVLCSLDAGPAITMLAAAVEADSEARNVGRAFRLDHAEQFQSAFEPMLDRKADRLASLFKGLVAAANSICDDRMSDQITTQMAIETLTHILVTSLSPFASNQT